MANLECKLTREHRDSILNSNNVLGVISFGSKFEESNEHRLVEIDCPVIGSSGYNEVWQTDSEISSERIGDIGVSRTARWLFLSTRVEVSSIERLEESTFRVWCDLLDTMYRLRYTHLVRAWNHIPYINCGKGDEEGYRRFNVGRFRAFKSRVSNANPYPASTGIGYPRTELIVYLLASKESVEYFDNPMQISAWKYPKLYGPKPPSFSRASVISGKNEIDVFVSGTASIVGHKSIYKNDFDGQFTQTLNNIDCLLENTSAVLHLDDIPSPRVIRTYLRSPIHAPKVEDKIRSTYTDAEYILLLSNICRKDLEIEIECFVKATPNLAV